MNDLVKRDFPKIKRDLWKEMFWSRSYCLVTTGGAPINSLRKLVKTMVKKKAVKLLRKQKKRG
ncbi:hypothetical protein BLD50_19790 [Bacillus cereus]|nr:hypothetical protein BLD50_19790 [Bacillus cereus]